MPKLTFAVLSLLVASAVGCAEPDRKVEARGTTTSRMEDEGSGEDDERALSSGYGIDNDSYNEQAAHELAHPIQQAKVRPALEEPPPQDDPEPPYDSEAE